MANFISEDDIEQELLKQLKTEKFWYDIIICDSSIEHQEDLNDWTWRKSKRDSVLPNVLRDSLYRLNPNVDKKYLDEVFADLTQDFSWADIVQTNYDIYNKIRWPFKISITKNWKEDFELINLIDFEYPENNVFTAVSQMWIKWRYNWRRPDVLIFVNWMPLVFIELKNGKVKIQEAYNKNLQDYRKDVPNLFPFNQICVLSNWYETKLWAFNATYDYFFEWLKESENDQIDREKIKEAWISIQYFINWLLKKEKLLDYIENFIMFYNQSTKVLAKNHQYLWVNNLVEAVKNREELKWKLWVFWHTQWSWKSFSMIFFTRKVKRKIPWNFTFLIVTDRDDLDTQIHKNFVRTWVIWANDETQPKNSTQLRQFLEKNKEFVFTLIHKFRYDKWKQYPILSTRNDIFVLVDEAHRTQYKDLAENMRAWIPNANYIAFTGTPLLWSKRLTNQWFWDYVSEYNFAQSVEDGSTVPIFYSRRVPEVWLENNFLDDDIVEIIEEENLNERETELLENSASKVLQVIKADDRLEKVAKDIAHHFPRRWFLWKAMVVSVDKFTAVKMYDKVQKYWIEERKAIVQERNVADTKEKRDELNRILDYMDNVEMAVVISDDNTDPRKYEEQWLDIMKHRKKLNEVTTEWLDIEDRFKDPNDKLQLVFVCAMWLTWFDVPNLSTLYLDKPMKAHTLMQAIARTNRVYPWKSSWLIVDYVNVFKYMEKALADYAIWSDWSAYPAKNIDNLVELLEKTIKEADTYLETIGISLDKLLEDAPLFEKLEDLRKIADKIVEKEETKDQFKVITNTMVRIYESLKPEVFERHWKNEKYEALDYINWIITNRIDDEKLDRAKLRLWKLLDSSVISDSADKNEKDLCITQWKVIDLSKIDAEALRAEIKQAEYKWIEIEDLKAFLEKALERMINQNTTRIKFSERFKSIIDRYNAWGTENEEYYEKLIQLIEDLKKEEDRAETEWLTEEELEIYDLLIAWTKLTKADEQKVKLAAKNLYNKITANSENLLVIDWYKDRWTLYMMDKTIQESLNEDLPDAYDVNLFKNKSDILLKHFIRMAAENYWWIANI